MPKKVSEEDKQRARDMFAQGISYRDIGKAIGCSAASISGWAHAEGWLRGILPTELVTEQQPQIFEPVDATAEEADRNTEKLHAVNRRRWEDRKRELADMCADGAGRIYAQIFEPHTLKEVKTVGMGNGVQELRMVEIPLKEPTPAEKKALATTMAILIDKASLLAGDATSRTETSSLSRGQAEDRIRHIRDELATRRADKPTTPEQKAV
jgi:hypothetical protein